jgi:lipoprotein Spr
MRKFSLALFTLLFLATTVANAARARKKHHVAHRHHHKREHFAAVFHSIDDLNTDSLSADSVIGFAQTLIGTRYREASANPLYGFDCSGFVSYVFKSFDVKVPRSSGDFINVGERISMEDAKPGDVILFTGTRSHHPHSIGHVGIVYSNDHNGLKFIHSTSGKEHGVTITAMDDTYRRRFVQVVRLLKQNDDSVLASR